MLSSLSRSLYSCCFAARPPVGSIVFADTVGGDKTVRRWLGAYRCISGKAPGSCPVACAGDEVTCVA